MLLGTSRLTGLSANLLAEEQDALALVRLWLTERANLGTHLAKELLVAGFKDYLRVLVSLGLCLNLDFRGKLEEDGVRVAECELQEVALVGNTIADTDQLKLLLIAFGNSDDHIVDEGAVEAVESLLLLRLDAVVFLYNLECYLCIDDIDFDGGVNRLGHLALRAFHGNFVVVADADSHSGRNAYGQFTYS